VTIVVRRRGDGPPLPDPDHFEKTGPAQQKRIDSDEFASKYGAHPEDLKRVISFAERFGLRVTTTSVGRRTVVVTGNAAQFSGAFGVTFGRYQQPTLPSRGKFSSRPGRPYRGRDGFIYLPKELDGVILGVFGLDNRPISLRCSSGDPPVINTMTVQQVTQLYNFPAPGPGIGTQTIGIIAPTGGFGGYLQSDIDQTFNAMGLTPPQVIPISVDNIDNTAIVAVTSAAAAAGSSTLTFASAPGIPIGSTGVYVVGGVWYEVLVTAAAGQTLTVEVWDTATNQWVTTGLASSVPTGTSVFFNVFTSATGETNQDICIAASAAPGANIAVYFTDDTQAGWVDLLNRVLQPEPGDFPPGVNPPSVLSASWVIGCDDPDGLSAFGIASSVLDAMDNAFKDAALQGEGVTVCVASGDTGSNCYVGWIQNSAGTFDGDGYAHVFYPASDPWVLSVGGTAIGQYQPSTASPALAPVEYAWNDEASYSFSNPSYPWGTGGGGVSDYFPVPSYQSQANVPKSINPGITPPAGVTVTPPSAFNATGRGVPDVASNASYNSGYSGFYLGGSLSGDPGNGTSAAAPLWAGLIAVLNANAGFNIGFANPTLYALGVNAFNPINPLWPDPAYSQLAGCPTDNGNNGVPGYPAGPGWDAFTGLGSPNGLQILGAFEQLESVYVLGGYQSPDIIITDLSTNVPVPIGGAPGGSWDTLLEPSTSYGFSANVHNDSSTDVNNVVVSFWAIPGGVGTNGTMVGSPQTVSIPAQSTVTVTASADFVSAPTGQHLCAVVSIYSPTTGCDVNANDALEIPNPGYSMTHQCSAWRNTDSMTASSGGQIAFPLGFGKLPIHFPDPIVLRIRPIKVPENWHTTAKARAIEEVIHSVGAKGNMPPYLLPAFNRAFHSPDLSTKITVSHGAKIEPREPGIWSIVPHAKAVEVTVEITAHVPKDAVPGDVLLLNVTADYPEIDRQPARSVEFLEFVHVVAEKRKH